MLCAPKIVKSDPFARRWSFSARAQIGFHFKPARSNFSIRVKVFRLHFFHHPINQNETPSPSISFSSSDFGFLVVEVRHSRWRLPRETLKKPQPRSLSSVPEGVQQFPQLSQNLASIRHLTMAFLMTPLDSQTDSVCATSLTHKRRNFTIRFA